MPYIRPTKSSQGVIQDDVDGVLKAVDSGVPYETVMTELAYLNELERQHAMMKYKRQVQEDNENARKTSEA